MSRKDEADLRDAAARDLHAAGAVDAGVEVVPYDPGWPERFSDEAARLGRIVPALELHHIGSTAVPGLAAKPVIDMMAHIDELDELLDPIIEAGYQYPEAYNAVLEGRRWFCRPSAIERTHHLHLVADRGELDRHLRFRDALRRNADLADEYAALKLRLAQDFNADREGYTAGKSAFVERVEALAP